MRFRGGLRAWALGGLAMVLAGVGQGLARSQGPARQALPRYGVGTQQAIPLYGQGLVYTPVFGGYYGGGYGYGGYGYGGYGYGGYGPFGGMGMTLYDQEMYKQQQYALANSRYNLQNAQATQAYQQANYYNQRAIGTALDNQKQMQALREKYDPRNALPKYSSAPAVARPTVPLSRLVSGDNAVMWPAVAPDGGGSRNVADGRIAQVAKEFHSDGQAKLRSVVDARDALYAYGRPALESVRKYHPSQGEAFKDFLNNLDMSLDVMAQPPKGGPKAQPMPKPAPETPPAPTPEPPK